MVTSGFREGGVLTATASDPPHVQGRGGKGKGKGKKTDASPGSTTTQASTTYQPVTVPP